MALKRVQARLALAAAMVCVAPLLAVSTAHADTTPPWEPDNAALGSLTFYNSSGNVVTGGANLNHLFDYVEASTDDPTFSNPSSTNTEYASLEFANPTPGQTPVEWTGLYSDEQSSTPDPSAPGSLATTTHPVVALDANGAELKAAIGDFVANTKPGYVNVYQVRVFTTDGASYWESDIQVNPTTQTWAEIYPTTGAAPKATSTVLTGSPSSPATQGATVTFTATETAADSTHPAGSVQFYDGTQTIGSAVAVNSSGVASVTDSTLLPGTHTIKADFTTTADGYSNAPEKTLSFLVNPKAATPTISGTFAAGKSVTCTEATTSGETVSYEWLASGKKVGSGSKLTIPGSAVGKTLTCQVSVNVSGGTASTATSAGKKVAEGAALKASKKPTLSGAGKVGKTEKVAHGTWKPAATKYAYQWYAGSAKIKGATKSSYKIASKYKGKKLSCKVTATATGFKAGSATTKSVTVKK